MTKREATNGVASQLPERRMTAMPTTCVKRKIPHTGCPKKHAPVGFGTSQTSLFFSLFFQFFFSVAMEQKTYFAKVVQNAQKPRRRHLSRPRRPFWGPLATILDFPGSAALRRYAGILLFSSFFHLPDKSF